MSSTIFSVGLILSMVFFSCTTSKNPFKKQSPHAVYGDALTEAGLQRTKLGSAWFSVAESSLQQPAVVTLPYKETGYFAADKPAAHGYIFSARRGDKLIVTLNTLPAAGIKLFAEIWQPAETNSKLALLTATDTLSRQLQLNIKKDGRYLVRIQPELLQGIEYTITINTAPSLAFPVHKSGNPKVISLWGVARDGGARRHEGVDISAKRSTPALASADGIVSRVNENELGGKVVFLSADEFNFSIYYAHLDQQSVKPGQRVKAGDEIGLVGNSGNAKTTIPHLHYGIYTNEGAIDPIAFIDTDRKEAKAINVPLQAVHTWRRTTSGSAVISEPSTSGKPIENTQVGDALFIEAAIDKFYKVALPSGKKGFVAGSNVSGNPFKKITVVMDTRLLDAPRPEAPSMTIVPKGMVMDIIGNYMNFSLVRFNNMEGWVSRKF